jgi:hypothetical protein
MDDVQHHGLGVADTCSGDETKIELLAGLRSA